MRAIVISGVVILCFLISYLVPLNDAISDDTKACLRCHGMKTLQKALDSGGSFPFILMVTNLKNLFMARWIVHPVIQILH